MCLSLSYYLDSLSIKHVFYQFQYLWSNYNMQSSILTVTQLNMASKELLETAFADVLVEGEVSNFVCPSSGHWYFSLKDESSQIKCAMFRQYNFRCKAKLKNGDLAQVRAKVSLYPDRGDYQLIVNKVELSGEGLLRKKYDELLNKLSAEGLFLDSHKKIIPIMPKRIGIVTSPSGAAIRDVLSVLKRRFPSIPITVYPTEVQGANADKQIIKAITDAELHNVCDVLIVTRGGGSIEDLWCFNSEALARVIFACKIPIISGVGHEIDFTICDFVADKRAPTPSVAAEMSVLDVKDLLNILEKYIFIMKDKVKNILSSTKQKLHLLTKNIKHPKDKIKLQLKVVESLKIALENKFSKKLQNSRVGFSKILAKLNAVSPIATLDRGYSIVTKKNGSAVVSSVKDIKESEEIKIKFRQGQACCIVDKLEYLDV